MVALILNNRQWLNTAETILLLYGVFTYFIVVIVKRFLPRFNRYMRSWMTVSGGVIAGAMAIQVVICSAEGDIGTTLLTFGTFSFIIYFSFIFKPR